MRKAWQWVRARAADLWKQLFGTPVLVGWGVRIVLLQVAGWGVARGYFTNDDAMQGVSIVLGALVGLWSLNKTTKQAAENKELKQEVAAQKQLSADAIATVARMNAERRRLRAMGEDPDALEEHGEPESGEPPVDPEGGP